MTEQKLKGHTGKKNIIRKIHGTKLWSIKCESINLLRKTMCWQKSSVTCGIEGCMNPSSSQTTFVLTSSWSQENESIVSSLIPTIFRWNNLLTYQMKFKIKHQGYGCPYESSTAAAIWRCKDLNSKSKPSKVLLMWRSKYWAACPCWWHRDGKQARSW